MSKVKFSSARLQPTWNDILVKFVSCEYFLIATIYDRAHGKKNFYFSKKALTKFVADPDAYTYGEKDGENMAFVSNRDDNAHFEINWGSIWEKNSQFTQTFTISKEKLKDAIEAPVSSILCHNRWYSNPRPILDFFSAGRVMQEIQSDKQTKRAFSKALDKNFNWPDTKRIKFYPDGKYSFYFIEEMKDGSRGITGGFIRHENELSFFPTKTGRITKIEYSMHT